MKLQVEDVYNAKGDKISFRFEQNAADLNDVSIYPWGQSLIVVEGLYWFDGNHIVINGIIHTQGVYTCSRCLTDVTVDRNAALSEVYGAEVELPENVLPYNGEYIDLTETIREILILSEPMRVLCQETCAGLCPTCGANLNEEHCSCPTDSIDPRLAILETLKI